MSCQFVADGENCGRIAQHVRIMPAGRDWVRVDVCHLHARHLDTLAWARGQQRSRTSEQRTDA